MAMIQHGLGLDSFESRHPTRGVRLTDSHVQLLLLCLLWRWLFVYEGRVYKGVRVAVLRFCVVASCACIDAS